MRTSSTNLCAVRIAIVVVGISISQSVLADPGIRQVDPYAGRKLFYEEVWQRKIASALSYVDGAVVCVNVELTPEIHTKVTREQFGDRPVVEFQMQRLKESDAGARRPMLAQAPTRTGEESRPRASDEEKVSKMAIAKTSSVSKVAGLIPVHVTATVSIPRSYIKKVWWKRDGRDVPRTSHPDNEQLVATETEIRNKIELTVATLLPQDEEGNVVRVVTFDDVAGRQKHAAKPKRWPTKGRGNQVTITVASPREADRMAARLVELQPTKVVVQHPADNE